VIIKEQVLVVEENNSWWTDNKGINTFTNMREISFTFKKCTELYVNT